MARPLHELTSEANSAAQRGDEVRARQALYAALGHTVVREDEYVGVTAAAKNILLRLGDARGALTTDWYAGNDRSQKALLEKVPPTDRARSYLSWADRAAQDPRRTRDLYARAADEYEAAGLIARAAICREKAEDFPRARALWSRLSHVLSQQGHDLYAAGLARFNLARTSNKTSDPAAAREATVESVHLLEEAADRYETIGQRERAFDCFQVLIAIGRESGEFEHVLEGYVNVIRILREDHLRYYALQSYEEAVEAAEKQGEASAAATLAREMSSYAKKEGLVSIANFGIMTQARLWREVARRAVERGSPAEIAENAMLAAVMAFGEAGQFQKVAELYRELGALPLAESRRKHYARATNRYQGAADLRVDAAPLPAHLRHEVGYPEVWHVDLVEWEQQGSASEACGDVILDPSWTEVTRRRAVLARLSALSFEQQLASTAPPDQAATIQLATALADQLSQVELYTILSPLEHLYRRPEPAVRLSVMRALSRFLYKRTFITLREGLTDPDKSVAEEAARAVEELRFPHAFDPLARIYRESSTSRARVSALRALAKIDTVEVAEMLLGVIEHDGRDERIAAVEALKRARGTKFVEIARAQLAHMAPQAQQTIREILQVRAPIG
ncbi:MAG: HEAT repeat domain-containing protein [Polyangiaceae bacterium]|nr:HEAT repeat domain-containing protein [Polyangiaceae bacterium]